ncbi:hypothetical protein DL95DRAFT_481888, partial [Leptodontidium sp. 2 PMI_412]
TKKGLVIHSTYSQRHASPRHSGLAPSIIITLTSSSRTTLLVLQHLQTSTVPPHSEPEPWFEFGFGLEFEFAVSRVSGPSCYATYSVGMSILYIYITHQGDMPGAVMVTSSWLLGTSCSSFLWPDAACRVRRPALHAGWELRNAGRHIVIGGLCSALFCANCLLVRTWCEPRTDPLVLTVSIVH